MNFIKNIKYKIFVIKKNRWFKRNSQIIDKDKRIKADKELLEWSAKKLKEIIEK